MATFSREFINRLKQQIDIVDIIKNYVDLKKSGKNYMGLCPFHQEKTPSFSVNPEKQFYHCFGCGAGGDVINFLMEIDSLSFQEAVKHLASSGGIELPDGSKVDKSALKVREGIFAANELAAKFYNYLLKNNDCAAEAREYLKTRGYHEEDYDNFKLGYSPDSWKSLYKFLSNRGFSQKILLKSGLIGRSQKGNLYDKFRNRIIFPIYNHRGEIIGFGGRALSAEDEPKYLNSPETKIFSKKKILYGINWAKNSLRQSQEAIIMEGYTDVLTARKKGIKNVVASLGTALTAEQVRLLNRYTDKVYIAYDADAAGNMATLRGLEICRKSGLKVAVIELPADTDPDEIISQEGAAKFQHYQNQAKDLISYRLDLILAEHSLQSPAARLEAAREGVKFLATLDDSLVQETYLQVLAEKTSISAEKLQEEIQKQRSIKTTTENKNFNRQIKKSKQKSPKALQLDWKLLAGLIYNEGMRQKLMSALKPEFFHSKTIELARVLWSDPSAPTSEILAEVDDDCQEKVSREIFAWEKKYTQEELVELTRRIKQRSIAEEITHLINLLKSLPREEKEVNLKANDILLYYKKLLGEERRSRNEG